MEFCARWPQAGPQGVTTGAIGHTLPGHAGRLRSRCAACTFANRILGFINAPAIWQWVEAEAHQAAVDVAGYQHKRDLLCDGLARIGYQVSRPEGAYYVFLKFAKLWQLQHGQATAPPPDR